ncbi:MAG: sugar phosphate isomerase/epimerase family protein [Armatimonadota bacterium]
MITRLGCFTRPWDAAGLTLDEALAGISGAGYRYVGLNTRAYGPGWSESDRASLRAKLDGHGLSPHVGFANPDLELPLSESVDQLRKQIAWCRELGMRYLLLLGTEREDLYDRWFEAVAQCLDHAGEHGMMMVLKPHDGISRLAPDMLRAVERLRHPAFGICYDPGNILYYTGLRPEDDLPKVAEHVRAMCIKDEIGGKHGEVMITPGTGDVDFRKVFSILAGAGFSGPMWVECVGGKTPAELTEEARKAREFIERLL